MSSNSILHSVESERRWALEIDNNFPKEHIVDIDFDTPTCVFRVPKSLSETKPEAYAPQLLGLGPYHHLRPDFYMMQKQKLSAVRRYLSAEKLQDFNQVVEALIQWEPVLRACYDQYLDFDIRTLARILAIDALYLLQFFEARKSGEVAEMDKMAGDIMMLENQIPVILLEKIVCVLGKEDLVDHALFREFKVFCEAYSPLKLNQHQQITEENKTLLHLLHCMYYLIVTNTCIKETMTLELATGRKIEGGISIEEAAEISIEEPRLLSIKEEVISIEATAEISIEETLEVSIEEAGEISIEETVEISIEEPRRLSIKEVISTEEAAAGLSIEEPRLVSITEEVIAIKETMMPIEVSYTRVSVQEVEGVVIPFMVESGCLVRQLQGGFYHS
ncbi:hypothetical protein Pfo_003506 [Paulownia fortunei]|nr:hypothetical protein Pfo_003506 [Paulownia fortunei]